MQTRVVENLVVENISCDISDFTENMETVRKTIIGS